MEIKSLITLKTIVEEGSFQKASEKLGYSQAAITFHIRQLEEEIGIHFFDKIGRKKILNQYGKAIIPYINNIINDINYIEDYGKSINELKGHLTIAMPESFLVYRMQPILRDFKAQAPHVQLYLQALNGQDIISHITAGKSDLAIHYDTKYPDSIEVKAKLSDYSLTAIASPAFDSSILYPIGEKKHCATNYIINDHKNIYRDIMESYLNKNHLILENTFEFWSIEAVKKSVASNLGISLLPSFTVEKELEDGILKEIPNLQVSELLPVYCILHKNKWITPAMDFFLSILKSHFLNERHI